MLGPLIVGEQIALAPLGAEHLEPFCRWFADQEVIRYLLVQFPPSLKQEQEWYDAMVRDERRINWGIFVDGTLVGTTSLEGIDWRNRHASSGTVIGDKAYWRRGIGSEAMRLRTDYAFRQLGFEKLKSSAFAENAASRASLARAGYREIGIQRREYFREGRWHDVVLLEILREEWAAHPNYQGRGESSG